MRRLRLEPYIAQLYTDATGRHAEKWPHPARSAAKPYLGVNPDYFAVGRDHVDMARLVECKSHLPWLAHYYGEPGSDQAPEWELVQAQWQMHHTGYRCCDIAVLLGLAEEDFRIYTVAADSEIGGMLEEAGDRFWRDHILRQVPPSVGASNADSDLLKRLYPIGRETAIVATPEVDAACVRLRDAKARMKATEADVQCHENTIKAFMGPDSYLESSVGPFSWKTSKSAPRWKAIAEELQPSAALIAKHTGDVGPRRFLTPFKGDK